MNGDFEHDCTMRVEWLRQQQPADKKRSVNKEKYKRYNAKRAKKMAEKSSEMSSTGRSVSSMSGFSPVSNRVNVDDDLPSLILRHNEEISDVFEKVVVEDVLSDSDDQHC